MGREGFDGEGAGDADLGFVLVGFVVEELELGLGGDGGVNFLLAGDAGFPPGGVELLCRGCRPGALTGRGPWRVWHASAAWGHAAYIAKLARDFPFLPGFLEGLVQLLAQRFEGLLPFVLDDINLGVVGDGFEGDVRDALIDEAVAEVFL